MPAGTVHRATAKADSMHVTVGVARTHHRYTWASLLQALLESATGPAKEAKVTQDESFAGWLHDLAGEVRSSAEGLHRLLQAPRAFAGQVTTPTGPMWVWNRLSYSVSLDWDLQQEATGHTGLIHSLQHEFQAQIQPLLLQAAAQDPDPGSASLLKARIIELERDVLGDTVSVGLALRSLRALMADSMAPLVMKPDYNDRLAAGHKERVKAAGARAGSVTRESVFVREASVRAYLRDEEGHGETLQANVPGYAWPATFPEGYRFSLAWALSVTSGAKGKPFRLCDLDAAFAASGHASKQRWPHRDGLGAVKWMVARQLLRVAADHE